MEKIDKMGSFGQKELPVSSILSVDCFDTIKVKARTTFDAETVGGIQITYWLDDEIDVEKRMDAIFDYLFDEYYNSQDAYRPYR